MYNNLFERMNKPPVSIPPYGAGDEITYQDLNRIVYALNRTAPVIAPPMALQRPERFICKRIRPVIGQDALDGNYSGPEIPITGKSNHTNSNDPSTVYPTPLCYALGRKGSTPAAGERRSYLKFFHPVNNAFWHFNLSLVVSNNGIGGATTVSGATTFYIGFVNKPSWDIETLTWNNQPGKPTEKVGITLDFPRLSNATCYSEIVSFQYQPKLESIGGLMFWFDPVPGAGVIVDYTTGCVPAGTPDVDASRNPIYVTDPNDSLSFAVVRRKYAYPDVTLWTNGPHDIAVGDWIFVDGVGENYDVTPWTTDTTRKGPARVTAITKDTVKYTINQTYEDSEKASSGKVFYW